MPITIGNDIVDLNDAAKKDTDPRFLKRVFTSAEQRLIKQSDDPHTVLWAIWAAKEAVFKAYQKQYPNYRFSPIQCQLTEQAIIKFLTQPDSRILNDAMCINNQLMACQWHAFGWQAIEAIHCTATFHCEPYHALSVHRKISRNPGKQDYRQQSESVRREAQQLLQELGFNQSKIDKPIINLGDYTKPGPPFILANGQKHEISLSHDGDYLAITVGLFLTQ